MAAPLQDLRFSLRVLRKAPGFTLVATLTLGLGIGVNAAMVGLFDALLVRPPEGVSDPKRVVSFRAELPSPPGRPPELTDALSFPQLTALRTRAATFSGVAAYAASPLAVGEGEAARNEEVVLASGEFFSTLGVRAARGRLLQPDDDLEGAANPVAVLSWEFWNRAYGGDPAVLGGPIRVAGRTLTIIGVAPKNFVGAELQSPALWAPLSMAGQLGYDAEMIASPYVSWLKIFGRLAPGVTPEQAAAAAQAALLAAEEQGAAAPPPGMRRGRTPGAARVAIRGPGGPDGPGDGEAAPPRVKIAPLGGAGIEPGGPGGGQRPVQLWYLAVTAAVLLIACANVANLLLARGAYREHELAVRLSMGATPRRLARQLLTESAVLSVLGAAAGLAVALVLWRLLPAIVSLPPLPPLMDRRALAIVAVLTVLTVVLFGLIPLLGLRRPDIRSVLGSSSPSLARRSRGRSALVVAQFAVCVVLLVGAGLFVRSFQQVRSMDLGYDRDRVLVVTADTRGAGWTPERTEAFWAAARERIEALPGVERVEAAAVLPYLMRIMMPFTAAPGDAVEGVREEPVQLDFVGPDYFATLGIRIEEGRPFDPGDRRGAAPVAIVSRSFARRHFAAPSPVGRCLASPAGDGGCIQVVGVAEDARFGELTDASPEFVYRPLEQRSPMMPPPGVLHVRVAGDPQPMADALRAEMRAADPTAPAAEVRTLAELTAPQLAPWRASAILLGVFGAMGLLLAAVGLYGVIAFLVARRTREIGIRVALGAARGSVVRLVLGDAARLVGAGAALGLLLAAGGTRLVGSMLYGVSPLDPPVYLATGLLLAAVALLAALSPARRALRVDPMEALRTE